MAWVSVVLIVLVGLCFVGMGVFFLCLSIWEEDRAWEAEWQRKLQSSNERYEKFKATRRADRRIN